MRGMITILLLLLWAGSSFAGEWYQITPVTCESRPEGPTPFIKNFAKIAEMDQSFTYSVEDALPENGKPTFVVIRIRSNTPLNGMLAFARGKILCEKMLATYMDLEKQGAAELDRYK